MLKHTSKNIKYLVFKIWLFLPILWLFLPWLFLPIENLAFFTVAFFTVAFFTDYPCSEHFVALENYYNAIVIMSQRSSHDCVPVIPVNCLKAYWNDDLDRLKSI